MSKKIVLGRTYRDRVTGMEGVAICTAKYLSGCDRVGLQPPVNKDKEPGKVPDSWYFDVNRVDVVGKKQIEIDDADKPKKQKLGGPQPVPRTEKGPRLCQ